ncbi:hypothetical protein LS482_17170 [Sinomicrobium kalidii]|uniref:hypothetical protein n=1 Tax=Sinomicrobium kalidii TaxID=2900738 RepID=UPI001E62D435|nr:hypothetical protein [Sinomicrobium kalidii]UGU15400.1 hypothetical protein LS482_17170 [Sinomicrobium kalidii]
MKLDKSFRLLLFTALLSIGVIGALYHYSHQQNRQPGSFVRLFPPHVIEHLHPRDIKYNSYYIAGMDHHNIYLGNTTAPLHLLKMNMTSKDTSHIRLHLDETDSIPIRQAKVTVNPPYFYITDGTVPVIYKGKTLNWSARADYTGNTYFTKITPLTSRTFAIRSVTPEREYILGKLSTHPIDTTFIPGLLEKQVDGLFCTDGMLHYDQQTQRLVYLYHYRNQFMVTDTSLHLLYRGHTIDTITSAQIKVTRVPSENTVTLAAPPLVVNAKSALDNNWLFVHSKLRAKNEDRESFEKMTVIDVYDLTDGKYRFSFYLPVYQDKKAKSFKVFAHKLVALYGHSLVIYDLNPEYFGH